MGGEKKRGPPAGASTRLPLASPLPQLMFWIIASLYSASLWWARLNAAVRGAAPPPPLLERVAWCLFVGFCCGCAVSVKHTGLAAAGVVLLESFLGMAILVQARRGEGGAEGGEEWVPSSAWPSLSRQGGGRQVQDGASFPGMVVLPSY